MEDWQDLLSSNKWSTWLKNDDISTISLIRTAVSDAVNDVNDSVQDRAKDHVTEDKLTHTKEVDPEQDVTTHAQTHKHGQSPRSESFRLSQKPLVDVPLHVNKRVKTNEPNYLCGPMIVPPSRSRRSSSIFGILISKDFMVGKTFKIGLGNRVCIEKELPLYTSLDFLE